MKKRKAMWAAMDETFGSLGGGAEPVDEKGESPAEPEETDAPAHGAGADQAAGR